MSFFPPLFLFFLLVVGGTTKEVPKLDMSEMMTDPFSVSTLQECSANLSRALDNEGVVILTNVGFSSQFLDELDRLTRDFFSLSAEEKNKVKLSAGLPFGYESSEALYLSEKDIQDQKSDLKNSALDIPLQDTKETFQIMLGREKRGGEGEGGEKEHALWPVRPEGLAGAWRGYYRLVERVGDVVLRCVAYSLGKRGEGVKGRRGVDFFDDYTKDHRSSLRGLFYLEEEGEGERRGEEGEEIVRCGAHSDWGLMTLLRQAPSRGSSILQTLSKDGKEWLDIDPSPEELVLNLGDLMTFWSSHRWRAVKHRVVERIGEGRGEEAEEAEEAGRMRGDDCFSSFPSSPRGRMSFAYFLNLDEDAVVDCHDFPSSTCSFSPFNAHEYLMKKVRESQGKE